MIGRILNHRYRVVNLIGTGGMAHVYRAVNIGNRRSVAIKVLKEEFKDDPEFLRRFEREARAVLHLSHENIVRAYGVGEDEGLPFIVLEYVEGRTLKDLIREEGALAPKEAVEYGCQVLDALTAAHDAGIIHRDIKPQNVIITKNGRAKLTDFGIAREAASSTMTYAGSTVLGSVHYLSPEQAKGVPVTVESDIYSTGIMLYEMLSGEVPFAGDNSVAIALKHISEDPEPLMKKNPAISPALNDVVMRAVSKDPADRYSSAAAMRKDLLRALYDPYGEFAKKTKAVAPAAQKSKPAPDKKRKKLHMNWLYPITSFIVIVLVVMAIFFIQSRQRYNEETAGLQIVPALTARTADDAAAKAENYGFVFEVQDYETSATVPYGNVIAQQPDSGASALPGSTIYGIVSLGPDAPMVPNLVGMTLDEARSALVDAGLVLGETRYMISDVAIGYVCQQSPVALTETQPGTVVDLFISSASTSSFPMPALADLSFSEALGAMSEKAFSSVLVHEISQNSIADGLVVDQSPAPDEEVFQETPLELTVNVTHKRPYAADIAFNLDISKSGTAVTVTVMESAGGVAYERTLLETTLEKGEKVPVSLTARSDIYGVLELRLYVDGAYVRSSEASFTERID